MADMQRMHWNSTLSKRQDMFGSEPSKPALEAAAVFARTGRTTVLELGGGQGRDTPSPWWSSNGSQERFSAF